MAEWLKVRLGVFFNFEYLGNLNWIVIPLLVYFLVTLKRRKRWEKALVFVYLAAAAVLGAAGHGWSRYLLTLSPFTLILAFSLGWEIIGHKSLVWKGGISLLILVAVAFNIYQFRNKYDYFWKQKVSATEDPFPHELLKFINGIDDLGEDSTVLVCAYSFSFHAYHYYSQKSGLSYMDPRMEAYYFKRRNDQEDLELLKTQLHVKYIYLDWRFIDNDWRYESLRQVIRRYFDLAYQEKEGSLYRLREKPWSEGDLEKIFANDLLLRNGSFEDWSEGPQATPDFFKAGDNIAGSMVFQEENEVKVGKFAVKIVGDNFNFAQSLPNFKELRGQNLTMFAWLKTKVPNKYRLQIYDGINSSFSKRHSGSGEWELLQINHRVDPKATMLLVRTIQAEKTGGIYDAVFADGALLVKGNWNTFYIYRKSREEK